MDVDAGLDQLGGHHVGARPRVLVHEAAGVGDQPDVQRLGDRLRRPVDAESVHQVPDDLGRARRMRVDEVDRAEAGVVVVVVDVEDAGRSGRCSASAAGLRSMLPQSRNTSVALAEVLRRRGHVALRARRSGTPAGAETRYSSMNMSASLPSVWRISCIAIRLPSASPSGFSWVTTTNFSASTQRGERLLALGSGAVFSHRSPASAVSSSSCGDPHAAIDGWVVDERERRRVLERQLGGDAPLEEAVRGAQPLEARLPLSLVAEHAHVDASVAQVWAGLDSGHCDESDRADP